MELIFFPVAAVFWI